MAVVLSSPLERLESSHPSLAQKLGSNYIPSAFETRTLESKLSEVQSELLSIQEEISRVQSVLHELQRSRDRVAEYAANLQALMSPARRMPPDIWSLIFTSRASSSSHPILSPLTYSLVCKGWREIALATPAVWSHLSLDLSLEPTIEADARASEGITLWLDRSGTTRISISLFHGRSQNSIAIPGRVLAPRDPPPRYLPHLVWETLFSQVYRWEHLDCQVNYIWMAPLLNRQPLTLPSLKVLTVLQDAPWMREPEDPKLELVIDNAPSLERVETHHVDFLMHRSSLGRDHPIGPDMARLTHIVINSAANPFPPQGFQDGSTGCWLDVLMRSPSLISFKATIYLHSEASLNKYGVVHLPHLRCLVLRQEHFTGHIRSFHCIISKLSCPALHNLSLEYQFDGDSVADPRSAEFVARCPSLSTMRLSRSPRRHHMDSDAFKDVHNLLQHAYGVQDFSLLGGSTVRPMDLLIAFRQIPNLKSLTIGRLLRDVEEQDNILLVLHATRHSGLLPNLQHLTLHLSQFTDACVIDVIESRLNAKHATSLTSCTLVPSYAPTDSFLLAVDRWRAQGLDIQHDLDNSHNAALSFDEDLDSSLYGRGSGWIH